MTKTRDIKTQPITTDKAIKTFSEFMEIYKKEGTSLRMEHISNLNGRRFVLVFDWEDMG